MEVHPSASLTINLSLERQDQEQHRLSSWLENRMWMVDSRLELRRTCSVYVLSYFRDEGRKTDLSIQTRDAPSIWWERHWRRGLISKVSLFLWRDIRRQGLEETRSFSISPRRGFTSHWDHLEILGVVELVDDLSLTLSRNESWGSKSSTRF